MGLTRWDAFTEMSILQREMNRIFDDVAQNWTGDGFCTKNPGRS